MYILKREWYWLKRDKRKLSEIDWSLVIVVYISPLNAVSPWDKLDRSRGKLRPSKELKAYILAEVCKSLGRATPKIFPTWQRGITQQRLREMARVMIPRQHPWLSLKEEIQRRHTKVLRRQRPRIQRKSPPRTRTLWPEDKWPTPQTLLAHHPGDWKKPVIPS